MLCTYHDILTFIMHGGAGHGGCFGLVVCDARRVESDQGRIRFRWTETTSSRTTGSCCFGWITVFRPAQTNWTKGETCTRELCSWMAVNSAELLNVACFDVTTLICCAKQTWQRGRAHCLKLLKHSGTSAPLHWKGLFF